MLVGREGAQGSVERLPAFSVFLFTVSYCGTEPATMLQACAVMYVGIVSMPLHQL